MQLEATITCPHCAHRKMERMPENVCVVFYDCAGCGRLLRPLGSDCCVFCSFGDVPCPPVQNQRDCCEPDRDVDGEPS